MDGSQQGHMLDFGDFTSEAIARVMDEFKARGYAPRDADPDKIDTCLTMAGTFLLYVAEVLKQEGLMDEAGVVRTRIGTEFSVAADESPENILRQLWDDRARDWSGVESAHNYALTMATLLEYWSGGFRRSGEKILSLGSGPGLYEIFLGSLQAVIPGVALGQIICADFAPEMTRIHQRLLGQVRTPNGGIVTNVVPITDDMTRLDAIHSKSIDQIICNNALQWVPEWRQAIAQMARVMRPAGAGWLYLFVHLHPMSIYAETGERLFCLGDFTMPELLDALEAQGFEICNTRQIAGIPGTGQRDASINRVFVRAKYRSRGVRNTWRAVKIEGSLRGVSL